MDLGLATLAAAVVQAQGLSSGQAAYVYKRLQEELEPAPKPKEEEVEREKGGYFWLSDDGVNIYADVYYLASVAKMGQEPFETMTRIYGVYSRGRLCVRGPGLRWLKTVYYNTELPAWVLDYLGIPTE